MDTLLLFGAQLAEALLEAVPFLLLGALASGLLDAYLSRAHLRRLEPSQPALAALMGALLGLALPVGAIGVAPVARRLLRKGASPSLALAFVLAGPVLNPVALAASYAALHEQAASLIALRVLVSLAVAAGIGILFTFQPRRERLLRDAPPPPVESDSPPAARGLGHALRTGRRDAIHFGCYLVLGALIVAGARTVLGPDALDSWADSPLRAVLALQAQGFVMGITSPRDAWVGLDFAGEYGLAAVLGFLTFGTMIDLKSCVVLLGVLRPRAVAALVVLAFLATTLIAVALALNARL